MKKFCCTNIPDINRINELLKLSEEQNQMSNFGPVYDLFKQGLEKYLNISKDKEITIVSSGHTALMAALSVLKSKKALIPAFTFSSTLQSALLQNIECFICDVSLDGYLTADIIDEEYKKQKFDTVILVIPLSVVPDIKEIENWCNAHSVKLVIDGASSFGTPNIQNFGDAFCLSFHATKSFPVGECGGIITKKELSNKVKSYINFGMDENKKIIMPGLNGKISEYTAAVGLSLLEKIDESIKKRLTNSFYLSKYLSNSFIPHSYSPTTVYQTFPIYIFNKIKKEIILKSLARHWFSVGQYYKPLASFPISSSLYENNISLPCHNMLEFQELKEMVKILND